MNDQERQLITDFVRRVAGADRSSGGPSPWAGQQQQAAPARPPLPPVDRDADGLILELFNKHPEARYRVTQTAFVQEHALAEAQNRIQQLEYELERTRREAQAAPSGGGGFLGGLFGGGRPAPQQPMPPPPQPVHAPATSPACSATRGSSRAGAAWASSAPPGRRWRASRAAWWRAAC